MSSDYRPVLALTLALLTPACGDDIDEEGADRLWDAIHAADYRSWQRAPGYETPQPTIRAHGETAEIFLNDTLVAALEQTGLSAWPAGSLIVKDSQKGSTPTLVAAMEKTSGDWFYAEWTAGGEVKYAGTPDVCTNCHNAGQDQLLTLALP